MSILESYNELKEKSNEIIEKYRANVDRNLWNNWSYPPYANFSDEDYVINLMGINPNVDGSNNKDEYEIENLNLYYVYKKGEIDNSEISKYVCENRTYVNNQYLFWNNPNYKVFDKPVKMSWQKYDEAFLKAFHKDKAKEYYKIIKEILEYYDNNNIEFEKDKYFIFTDLFYISERNQNSVIKQLNKELITDIKDLFHRQLDYYKSKITIVANSKASQIVKDNIIMAEKDNWRKIVLYGDEEYEDYSNIYKLEDRDSYVVLTGRYYDNTTNVFNKRIFAKEMRKLINNEIINEKTLEEQ